MTAGATSLQGTSTMQHPDPGTLELVLRQIMWNLAGNAATILVTLSATAIIGLGPIGRGLGEFLRNRSGRRRDDLQDATRTALAEIAERLDFMERALVAIKEGRAPAALPPRGTDEPRIPTPV